MDDEMIAYSESRHPAPHRDRVRLSTVFYGMFAAPIVWAGNLMVTFGLIGHGCYPAYHPLDHLTEGFGFAWPAVVAFYIVSLLICVSGFVVSLRVWRVTGDEAHGNWHQLMEVGEGRTRYFGLIGMSFSVLFFGAILFGAFVPFMLPLCAH